MASLTRVTPTKGEPAARDAAPARRNPSSPRAIGRRRVHDTHGLRSAAKGRKGKASREASGQEREQTLKGSNPKDVAGMEQVRQVTGRGARRAKEPWTCRRGRYGHSNAPLIGRPRGLGSATVGAARHPNIEGGKNLKEGSVLESWRHDPDAPVPTSGEVEPKAGRRPGAEDRKIVPEHVRSGTPQGPGGRTEGRRGRANPIGPYARTDVVEAMATTRLQGRSRATRANGRESD